MTIEGKTANPPPVSTEKNSSATDWAGFMSKNRRNIVEFWAEGKGAAKPPPGDYIGIFTDVVAFQGEGQQNITVVDINDATNPRVAGFLPGPSHPLHGREAYTIIEGDHNNWDRILKAHHHRFFQVGQEPIGKVLEFRPQGGRNRSGAVKLHVVESRVLIP